MGVGERGCGERQPARVDGQPGSRVNRQSGQSGWTARVDRGGQLGLFSEPNYRPCCWFTSRLRMRESRNEYKPLFMGLRRALFVFNWAAAFFNMCSGVFVRETSINPFDCSIVHCLCYQGLSGW